MAWAVPGMAPRWPPLGPAAVGGAHAWSRWLLMLLLLLPCGGVAQEAEPVHFLVDAAPKRVLESALAAAPDVLASEYHGDITSWADAAKKNVSTQSISIEMEGRVRAKLTQGGATHDAAVVVNGDAVDFEDVQGHWILKGKNNAEEETIEGLAFVEGKQVGQFKLASGPTPVAPWWFDPTGRKTMMASCLCLGLAGALIVAVGKSPHKHTRAYLHKVLSSAVTFLLGQLVAQTFLGFLLTIPQLAGFIEQALMLFLVFVGGWMALSFVAWKVQFGALYRMMISTLFADIIGFVGAFAFAHLWKSLESMGHIKPDEPLKNYLCAIGVLFASWVVFYVLSSATQRLREDYFQEESKHPWIQPGRRRLDARTQIPIARNENESALATYFPSAILSCGGLASMGSTSFPAQDIKPDWQHHVQWGENTIVSITEAFLVFKLVLLLAGGFNEWWETAVAFGLALAVLTCCIAYARCASKSRNENHRFLGSKFEHILGTILALLIGILLVNIFKWLFGQIAILSTQFILMQTQIFLSCVVFAMVGILILGCHFSTKERDTKKKQRFGVFHVQNNREEYEETDDAVGASLEVYVFAIMISLSLSDLFDVVLSVLTTSFDAFKEDPVLFKALFAMLAVVAGLLIWRHYVIHEAAKPVDVHRPIKGQDDACSCFSICCPKWCSVEDEFE